MAEENSHVWEENNKKNNNINNQRLTLIHYDNKETKAVTSDKTGVWCIISVHLKKKFKKMFAFVNTSLHIVCAVQIFFISIIGAGQ